MMLGPDPEGVIMGEEGRENRGKLLLDGTTRHADEYEEGGGLHFDNLYDQNEDEAGEKVDLATGEPIDNSTAKNGDIDPEVVVREGRVVELDLRETGKDNAGEKWLRKNDPAHPGYTGAATKKKKTM